MGVPVTGTIQTTDPATDTYAVIDPAEGIDGWRSVADHAARNAITTLRRREGMAVWTRSDGLLWTLGPGPWAGDDTDWTEFTGGGSGTVTSVATGAGLTGGTITTTGTIALADLAASSLLGNPTGSAASPSEITLGSGLAFAGTTLRATGGTGTVTSVGAGTGLTGGTITGAGTIALDVPVSGIHGGTGLTSATVGDILYASLANTWSALAGNATTTKKYLTGTGIGSAAQAPAWGTIVAADIAGLAPGSHAFGVSGTPALNATTPPIYLDRAATCDGLSIAAGTAPSGGSLTVQVQTSTDGTTWGSLASGAVSATTGSYSGTAACTTAIAANTYVRGKFTAVNGAADVVATLFIRS